MSPTIWEFWIFGIWVLCKFELSTDKFWNFGTLEFDTDLSLLHVQVPDQIGFQAGTIYHINILCYTLNSSKAEIT